MLQSSPRLSKASWAALLVSLCACGPATSTLGGSSATGPEADASSGASSGGGGSSSSAGGGPQVDASTAGESDSASPPPEKDAAGGAADATAGAGDAASDADSGAGPEKCTNRKAVDTTTWNMVWSDEFDRPGAPDPTKWGFEHGFVRNQELQWYQPDNATVAAGLLTIAAQKQQVANPNFKSGSSDWKTNRQFAQYTSSSMTSSGKWSYEYGRFEMCGQIDTRQGSWPAFWVLGNGRSWPSSGEVDIMEYYANNVRANVCKPSGSTCDWSGSVAQPLSSLGGSSFSSSFHLWAMEWDTKNINLFLDDKLVYGFNVSSAVSSGTNPYIGNPFFVLVNLAIGANGGDPSSTTFPITYKVDYVRVFQKR
jgi:beta-glucanase (GH16 family)